MQCSQCAHENPAGSRFCLECGTAMARACASCGAELPADARFCNQCGQQTDAPAAQPADAARAEQTPADYTPRHLAEKILNTRAALQGERKQVTVLFADVRGSMELSEGVDPEDWHRILDRFFQILSDGVHRFEGTVNQYTGDGIMALFGAPIAHEDHAHRACWAALHLREALGRYSDELRVRDGLDFSVRIGLNSGEVIVGKIGDDLRMDYTAQGQTVGLAARMESVAAPNTIALSGETAALVDGWFDLRSLGETQVKGIADPVAVFELEKSGSIRTRLDASRARGFSKFVGRSEELRSLDAAFERAAAGEGHIVGVVADAGVGKSRLCVEFLEGIESRGIPVRAAHCMPHGKLVPLLPVMELLRGFFEISGEDSPRAARNKIAGALLLLDRELEPSLPILFDLLGVPDPERPMPELTDEVRDRRMLDMVRRVIRARSEKEPGVILIEDLHWLDPASEDFVQHLIDVVPNTRTLLVLNFRPEYRADWMQRTTYQQLPLRPLGRQEIDALLRELLGPDPELVKLADNIRERSAGNPFFIEELVRHLADTGHLEGARGAYRLAGALGAVDIPPTVQPLLAARIDRLPEREKQVLQAASVLGEHAAESLLAEVVELPAEEQREALRQLVGLEFLRETALYPETEYDFLHPLMAEVAYGAQLSSRRAELHGRAARALEARTEEKSRLERAPLLAHHWDAAGEALPAMRWHRLAAERMGMAHPPECHRHWSRVRELADSLPEDAEAQGFATLSRVQLFGTGARIGRPAAEMEQLFRECEAIVAKTGSDVARARLLIGYAFYRMYVVANVAEARELLEEALSLLEGTGEKEVELGALLVMATTGTACDLPLAWSSIEKAREMMRAEPSLAEVYLPGSARADVMFCFAGGVILMQLGRLAESEVQLQDLKRHMQHEEYALGLHHTLDRWLATYGGDWKRAERAAALSAEVAEQSRNASAAVLGLCGSGEIAAHQGRHDEALKLYERALRIHREENAFRQVEFQVLCGIARVCIQKGEAARAVAVSEECIRFNRTNGVLVGEGSGQLTLAESLLVRDGRRGVPAARQAIDEAGRLLSQVGHQSTQPDVHRVRARIAEADGNTDERDRELAEAIRLWEEMGCPVRAQELRDVVEAIALPR